LGSLLQLPKFSIRDTDLGLKKATCNGFSGPTTSEQTGSPGDHSGKSLNVGAPGYLEKLGEGYQFFMRSTLKKPSKKGRNLRKCQRGGLPCTVGIFKDARKKGTNCRTIRKKKKKKKKKGFHRGVIPLDTQTQRNQDRFGSEVCSMQALQAAAGKGKIRKGRGEFYRERDDQKGKISFTLRYRKGTREGGSGERPKAGVTGKSTSSF